MAVTGPALYVCYWFHRKRPHSRPLQPRSVLHLRISSWDCRVSLLCLVLLEISNLKRRLRTAWRTGCVTSSLEWLKTRCRLSLSLRRSDIWVRSVIHVLKSEEQISVYRAITEYWKRLKSWALKTINTQYTGYIHELRNPLSCIEALLLNTLRIHTWKI